VYGTNAIASRRIDLRDATRRDAAALAALNVASWRAAYAHMLPEAFLASLDVVAREERLRRQLVCHSKPLASA
jgi:hypothetical protein